MAELKDQIQSADWKSEKHVPVIECDDTVQADEFFQVKTGLGKAVAHPNTTEHHIRWINLYFQPEGAKAPFHVAHFGFAAHGESVKGPNEGPVYAHHEGTVSMKISSGGTIYAMAYCNIHGLWQSSKEIKLK